MQPRFLVERFEGLFVIFAPAALLFPTNSHTQTVVKRRRDIDPKRGRTSQEIRIDGNILCPLRA